MSIDLPTASSGDNALTAHNALSNAAEAALNNLDGAALQASSVTVDKLAKPKALFSVSWRHTGDLVTGYASNDILGIFTLPNVDGAANLTFKFTGACIGARTVTKVANNSIAIRKNAVTQVTLDLNSAAFTSAAPLRVVPVAAVATASADVWDMVWTEAAGASYVDPWITLWFSLEHVGT